MAPSDTPDDLCESSLNASIILSEKSDHNQPVPSQQKCSVSSRSQLDPVPNSLTPFLRQPKVFFVKDSVAEVANLRKAEEITKTRIKSARASSSMNYEETVKHNLANPGREAYDVLMMSAPSKDIVNSRTVDTSCTNLIRIAAESLASNSNLKKVIIVEHPPRFDSQNSDKLAKRANAKLSQMWEHSAFKDKILIGCHNFNDFGTGKTHCRRYGNKGSGQYDGLHFLGPSGNYEFTKSIANIILRVVPDLVKRLPSNSHKLSKSQPSQPLPLYNSFAVLEEGNF